jgi:hypothetical protein
MPSGKSPARLEPPEVPLVGGGLSNETIQQALPGATPDLLETIRGRYKESLGFADLKRSGADALIEGLLKAIPPDKLDDQVLVGADDQGLAMAPPGGRWTPIRGPYTWRELIKALGDLRPPEETQGP